MYDLLAPRQTEKDLPRRPTAANRHSNIGIIAMALALPMYIGHIYLNIDIQRLAADL